MLNSDIQDILLEKKFEIYYDEIIKCIENYKSRLNDNNIDNFIKEKVGNLESKDVKEKMKLIDELNEYTIFLNIDIELEDGTILVGSEVWNEYKEIVMNNDISYAKKRVMLSHIMEKVDFFTYKLRKFTNCYSDCIGDIFYIEDGKQYFTDGKFDRTKFGEEVNHEFL